MAVAARFGKATRTGTIRSRLGAKTNPPRFEMIEAGRSFGNEILRLTPCQWVYNQPILFKEIIHRYRCFRRKVENIGKSCIEGD